jgi:putative ubiquitin-RnfH superfamily antitoxin RatB of RatAB toxin-antitoxin module
MKTPPYDNGKIKMGIYYEPPKYVEQDADMLEIQKWLIGDPVRLRTQYWIGVAMNCFIGFVVAVVVLMSVRN